jgi:hypothetical protein
LLSCSLICTINAFGLWFTLSNHLFIVLCVHTKRSDNNAASWTAFASKLFIVAALLQLLLMHKARVWYCRHRFSLAVANRLARLVQAAAMVLHSGFNATSSLAVNNSKAWQVLAGHVLLSSVLSLQASINFLLPANCTVFLQLLYVVISVAWHWRSPETMQGVPGVPELAGRVCTTLHGVFESVLSSAAAGAGVSSGPCSALGTAARTCSSGLVFEQLILYASFVVSYLVPLCGTYMAELHLKLTFWQKRQVQVELQRSVLLPLPEKPLLSNVLVLLIASALLWFVAEQAAPYMAVTGAPIGGVCAG